MSVLNLVYNGNELLREKSEEIKNVDEDIKKIASGMLDTMYKFDGLGLAAVQIGLLKRMITYDVSYIEEGAKKKPVVMINPKITWVSKTKVLVEEGCLSFPDVFKNVERYEKVKVEYIGLDGKKRIKSVKGMEAIVIQHETDHLDGVVFLDRAEENERKRGK